MPHKGWFFVDEEDLGEPSETCEMCEKVRIRFVYVMRHADYPDELRCGCVCAGNMEGDLKGARAREKKFKQRVERRRSFPASPRWKKSRNDNPYINRGDFNVTILKGRWGGHGYVVRKRGDGALVGREYGFATVVEAKMAAFDRMEGRPAVPKKAKPAAVPGPLTEDLIASPDWLVAGFKRAMKKDKERESK